MPAPRYRQTLVNPLLTVYEIVDTWTDEIVCKIPIENGELIQPILDKLNSL